jgi:hypothetical protein
MPCCLGAAITFYIGDVANLASVTMCLFYKHAADGGFVTGPAAAQHGHLLKFETILTAVVIPALVAHHMHHGLPCTSGAECSTVSVADSITLSALQAP